MFPIHSNSLSSTCSKKTRSSSELPVLLKLCSPALAVVITTTYWNWLACMISCRMFLVTPSNRELKINTPFFWASLADWKTQHYIRAWKIHLSAHIMGESSEFPKSWTFKTPILKLAVCPINIHYFKFKWSNVLRQTENKAEKLLWSP